MADETANLNGSGPQQVYISVTRTGQNYGGNYSSYSITVKYLAKGYGSFTGASQSWSASAGSESWSGSFTIPAPGTADITLLTDTFTRSHNSSGYGTAFTASASINTNHSSIGDGTVSVSEPAPPRIPKPPAAPGVPTFTNVLPTTLTAKWTASSNNNGASITGYKIQRATNSGFTTGVDTKEVSASTLTYNFTGLTPGTDYWFRTAAENSQGYGAWSASSTVKTPSGFYVWNGSTFRPSELKVWNGTAWQNAELYVWNGTSWVMAT